jgi:hypothetical protein
MKRAHEQFSRGFANQGVRERSGGRLKRVSMLAFGVALVIWHRPVDASQSFPTELASAAGMPCTPACTVCHRDNEGGSGTVVQPFGIAMFLRGGVQSAKPETVAPAFERIRAELEAGDSDKDQVSDLRELVAGTDPNVYGAVSLCIPEYGCGAHVAKSPPRDVRGPFALLLAGLAVVGLLRRQRPVRR